MDGDQLTPLSVPAYPLDTQFRNFRGVLIVSRDEAVLELSDSASFIARRVDGERSVADIGRLLADEYDADLEEAVRDTLDLLAELARHDLLEVAP